MGVVFHSGISGKNWKILGIYPYMKILISLSQLKRLFKKEEDELLLKRQQLEKVLHIPSINFFDGDWDLLQKFIKSKGNPPYSIGGDLDLRKTQIKSLGNLTSVGGDLDLRGTPIASLGNLTSVGGGLLLGDTPIKSLRNLKSVGKYLYLSDSPLSKKYTEKKIRQMVDVGGNIHL